MIPGEEKGWDVLTGLDPDTVSRNAAVAYDREARRYTVRSFGSDISVSVAEREITGTNPEGDALLKRIGYFYRLSALVYLTTVKDIPLTGRLVKPESMKGGQLFFRGSHVLPLNGLAGKYGSDREGFLAKGLGLGGETAPHGDAAVRLMPFPRFPSTVLLWLADDEFPARADLLLDSTCELQLPIDIIWSIAMMSVIVMM